MVKKQNLTQEEKRRKAIRKKVQELCEEDVDTVVQSVLEKVFWPKCLSSEKVYTRQHDDTDGKTDGNLQIYFMNIGDAIVSIDDGKNLRFRNWSGGGASLRVYTALIILAMAMEMDEALPRL
jgi:hypothetical protein